MLRSIFWASGAMMLMTACSFAGQNGGGGAEDAGLPASGQMIDRRVRELGDEDFRVRQKATAVMLSCLAASAVAQQQRVLRFRSWVGAVAFSPDGKTLAIGIGWNRQQLKLYDAATLRRRAELEGHKLDILDLAFSPDGKLLASGSRDNTAMIWDVHTGRAVRTLTDHEHAVWAVAFSPDGKMLATGSQDWTVKLWEVKTWKVVATLKRHRMTTVSLAFSRDGKTLATGDDDGIVHLWDVATKRRKTTLPPHRGGLRDVVFSPDGKSLLTAAATNTVRIWDASTLCERLRIDVSESVDSAAFSPDARLVAVGSDDGVLEVYDPKTGKRIAALRGHQRYIGNLAFSPDGEILTSASGDGTVRLWNVPTWKP